MPELSAQLPAIIGEAAKSPLGIFALMIISLAILGFFFFKEASEKTRIAIFSMLFVGVAVFGLSIVRTTSAAEPAPPAGGAGVEPPARTADSNPGAGGPVSEPAAATNSGGTKSAAERLAADPTVKSILGTWTADVIYFQTKSFRETFTFELLGDALVVTPTYVGSERAALNVKVGNGVVQFDIERQEISGDVTTDILSTYIGIIETDRIVFRMRNSNGDREARFEARRVDSR